MSNAFSRNKTQQNPKSEATVTVDEEHADDEDELEGIVTNSAPEKEDERPIVAAVEEKLAILVSHGCFNPIHRQHVEMMIAAKLRLESEGYKILYGSMAIAS